MRLLLVEDEIEMAKPPSAVLGQHTMSLITRPISDSGAKPSIPKFKMQSFSTAICQMAMVSICCERCAILAIRRR